MRGDWRKSVHDAPFPQVIRRHFQLHSIAWQNPHAIYPHAPRKMAQEDVALCLLAGDPDAECGIGETLFHNADELDDVFGHRKQSKVARKAEASYVWKEARTRHGD